MTYEAYGLGGVGMVIEILTDNLNRAAMTVRTVVTKAGAKMADPGSVLFNFERRGFVVLTGGDEDTVFAAATDAGADDVTPRPGGEPGWEIVTQVGAYGAVLAALRDAGLPMAGDLSGLRLVPLVHVDVVRPCARSAHARKQACDHALTQCAFVFVSLRAITKTDDEHYAANEALVEKLLELDDVDAVVSNQTEDEAEEE